MIIQTGMRTDIPAFYAEWFANRLRAGYVLVRNPYNPLAVTRYTLDPAVVDLLAFCTKNPAPLLPYGALLAPYGQYWFVTITPYGRDIEPRVPPKEQVLRSFQTLAKRVGRDRIGWRYDPILFNDEWTPERHLQAFRHMAAALSGYTETAVISFIQLYGKLRQTYPEAKPVPREAQRELTAALAQIAGEYGMSLKPCGDSAHLRDTGADCGGCMTVPVYEKALGHPLRVPPSPQNRKECACLLTADIGAYNTCPHLCRYCYANADPRQAQQNYANHDPTSPYLLGGPLPGEVIHQAKQTSWADGQMRLY